MTDSFHSRVNLVVNDIKLFDKLARQEVSKWKTDNLVSKFVIKEAKTSLCI